MQENPPPWEPYYVALVEAWRAYDAKPTDSIRLKTIRLRRDQLHGALLAAGMTSGEWMRLDTQARHEARKHEEIA